jgi:hypothetical protein
MSKQILVIYYSQTGQLGNIVSSLTQPLVSAGHTVEIVQVQPAVAYTFPWTGKSFFAEMPDSVLGVTTPLAAFQLKQIKYDLIVFGYQPWFLSPSIPANSILYHPTVMAVLKNTPVVTVTGARNMWLSAMERIRKTLKDAEAKHVGNIALVDKNANLVSFFTIQYWMFTGKKNRLLGVFPKPGVADADIADCTIFGNIIAKYIATASFEGMQQELVDKKAAEVKYSLVFIESKARRLFALWANFIAKRKNKTAWLVAYKYYLIIALLLVAPILLTIDAIFFKPFSARRIKRQKQYYSGVN